MAFLKEIILLYLKLKTLIKYFLPCIVCITTDGNLDKKSIGKLSAIPINKYDNVAPLNAKIKANLSPKVSPIRPNIGPPNNCVTANTVCNCPKIVGSAPNFFDKY